MFLAFVFVTLVLAIIAISANITDYEHMGYVVNSDLRIFPVDWYGKAMYLLGVAIIYLVAGFFVIPVG